MQPLKNRFKLVDFTHLSTFQSCVRTNDIELVGDGSHLTSFNMIGTFSFVPSVHIYELHVKMWYRIMTELGIKLSHITYHPSSTHLPLLGRLGSPLTPSLECTWSLSPTEEPSYCVEFFKDDLEIGNLVNPYPTSNSLGGCVDVGFGFERIVQLVEGKNRIDETTLFDQELSPIAKDHIKTLVLLYQNGIRPGNKGREYIFRRLLRRLIRENQDLYKYPILADIIEDEKFSLSKRIKTARKDYNKDPNKPLSYWWETHGILPEEMCLLE